MKGHRDDRAHPNMQWGKQTGPQGKLQIYNLGKTKKDTFTLSFMCGRKSSTPRGNASRLNTDGS